MKRLLTWLGGIFLSVLVVLAAVVGYTFYVGSSLDASSKAYVDDSIPSIVQRWSKDELLRRASPQLLSVASEEQFTQFFRNLSRLGTLQRYDGARGEAHIAYSTQAGRIVTAQYVADATFEHGPARVTMRLVHDHGTWQVLAFHVNSPLLLQ